MGGCVLAIATFVIKTLFARPAGDFRLMALIAMSVLGIFGVYFNIIQKERESRLYRVSMKSVKARKGEYMMKIKGEK